MANFTYVDHSPNIIGRFGKLIFMVWKYHNDVCEEICIRLVVTAIRIVLLLS